MSLFIPKSAAKWHQNIIWKVINLQQEIWVFDSVVTPWLLSNLWLVNGNLKTSTKQNHNFLLEIDISTKTNFRDQVIRYQKNNILAKKLWFLTMKQLLRETTKLLLNYVKIVFRQWHCFISEVVQTYCLYSGRIIYSAGESTLVIS